MTIIPADRLFKPRHKDYLGWLGCNPMIELSSSHDSAFIWYCACGDGDDLHDDLKRLDSLGDSIIVTLGDHDYGGCLSQSNRRFYFSTNHSDPERTVPYLYSDADPASRPVNKYLACFMGSFQTNPGRQCLKALAGHDVAIIESDWWHSEPQHRELRARYNELLDQSAFALCSRGIGQSSMRLAEAMLRGSLPIMIDDQTRLFGQDLGEFALWSGLKTGDIAHALQVAREMSVAEYGSRIVKMNKFVEDYLMVDVNSGCRGTLGYTEYLRRYVQKHT